MPSSVVKDGDTQQFQLQTTVSINYCTWYHWRGSIEYDDKKKGHKVDVPVQTWTLDRPDRTPWGFVQLRNASDYEMAHVSIYPKGHESEPPVAVLPTSYGKGEEAVVRWWKALTASPGISSMAIPALSSVPGFMKMSISNRAETLSPLP